jgi:hypothetical protein
MNLGIPLLMSFGGSMAALGFGSKGWHTKAGLLFAGLSALHVWQYRKKMLQDMKKGSGAVKMLEFMKNPFDRDNFFLSQVQVAHYIAGRIRLYCPRLVNNPALAEEIKASLAQIAELRSYKLNIYTGSILLEYVPSDVAKNPRLAKIEQAVIKKYRKA